MSRKSFHLRVLVTLLGVLIAAPAAVLTASSAAFADGDRCCQVSVDNMPAQFQSGGDPQPFTLHVVNQTQQSLRNLNVSFVLQADGLVGDLVHLQRQRVLGGPHNVGTFTQHGVHSGVVTANDQIDLRHAPAAAGWRSEPSIPAGVQQEDARHQSYAFRTGATEAKRRRRQLGGAVSVRNRRIRTARAASARSIADAKSDRCG